MLDRYRIAFLHEAHGPKPKVVQMGKTPTQRAGKVNSESFRVVRFEGCKPVSFSYGSDKEAPLPLPRDEASPLRLKFAQPNDGSSSTVTAKIQNDWHQDFPNSRVTFVMPNGTYMVDRGRIESSVVSDDARHVVLTVRLDINAESASPVTASAQ